VLAAGVKRREQPLGRLTMGINDATRLETNVQWRAEEPLAGERAVEDGRSVADRRTAGVRERAAAARTSASSASSRNR
jgi:hypothetical protein